MSFGNFNNPRRLTKRQTLRVMMATIILIWATQTLVHQSFGQQAPSAADAHQPRFSEESFLPGTARFAAGATIELRSEATIIGAEVKLKSICRWTDADQSVIAPIAETVLTRLAPGTPFRSISVQEIKSTLQDAGVSLAAINFAGAAACTVSRSDVEYDESRALQQWIDAKQSATAGASSQPSTQPIGQTELTYSDQPQHKAVRSLRDLLVMDLAQRLDIPSDTIQLTFKPQDEKALNLSEPHFMFDIEPQRGRDLGEVTWLVKILTDTGSRRIQIGASARAWQQQLVVAKPVAARTILSESDFIQRRTLAERLPNEPLLTKDQALGQQASRDLPAGTVLTTRMVDPVQLIKPGQFVTITMHQGGVQLKTVARAMESGAMGQTIRVKNETTRDILQVNVTGAQTAQLNPSGVASIEE